MKLAYFDCFAGASCGMILGALPRHILAEAEQAARAGLFLEEK